MDLWLVWLTVPAVCLMCAGFVAVMAWTGSVPEKRELAIASVKAACRQYMIVVLHLAFASLLLWGFFEHRATWNVWFNGFCVVWALYLLLLACVRIHFLFCVARASKRVFDLLSQGSL
jgi:cell division protein FtsW (lipid II flippase)